VAGVGQKVEKETDGFDLGKCMRYLGSFRRVGKMLLASGDTV
jgi:hypothetical protein